MKDLGKLKYFLGIEVAYSRQGIFISQRKYILDLLKEIGKLGCKITGVPIEQNHRTKNDEESSKVEKTQYQRLVGKLIYLSHTRPNIAYTFSVFSQFMHDPRERHLQAVNRIIQYLQASLGKGLLFKKEMILSMKVYNDADYAGSIIDRRSTSGYCKFLGGNLVIWRSKKQNVVTRSSAEAEFRAMAQGICELLWMKIILDDLKVKYEAPMELVCDNKSAISIPHNPVQHDRTKYVEVD
ncbi:secreted RxLR effector protein 161-like [Arachis stenosperma]|uniref:secreted RxLR effector protein 161-like n=1 Tax=Arachis stenosperma TaxID=217475 RepID=UPI0025AD0D48|nr:secreted RxLR effector protein 161-like [Arachis stenosperma]